MTLKLKAFIASASIGLIALFLMPGYEGAYRLSKWGFSGFALFFLSMAFLFSTRKSTDSLIPRERLLFLIAAAFVTSSIILPIWFTPYTYPHIGGALRLIIGFSFAYFTALVFEKKRLYKDMDS